MKIDTFKDILENETRLVTFRDINYTNDILLKFQNTAVHINKSFKHNIRIEKPSNLSSSRRPRCILNGQLRRIPFNISKKTLKILR